MRDYPLLADFIGLLIITFSIGLTIGMVCGLIFYDYIIARPTLRIVNEELHKVQEDNRYLYANNQRYEEIIGGTGREKRTQENG